MKLINKMEMYDTRDTIVYVLTFQLGVEKCVKIVTQDEFDKYVIGKYYDVEIKEKDTD